MKITTLDKLEQLLQQSDKQKWTWWRQIQTKNYSAWIRLVNMDNPPWIDAVEFVAAVHSGKNGPQQYIYISLTDLNGHMNLPEEDTILGDALCKAMDDEGDQMLADSMIAAALISTLRKMNRIVRLTTLRSTAGIENLLRGFGLCRVPDWATIDQFWQLEPLMVESKVKGFPEFHCEDVKTLEGRLIGTVPTSYQGASGVMLLSSYVLFSGLAERAKVLYIQRDIDRGMIDEAFIHGKEGYYADQIAASKLLSALEDCTWLSKLVSKSSCLLNISEDYTGWRLGIFIPEETARDNAINALIGPVNQVWSELTSLE